MIKKSLKWLIYLTATLVILLAVLVSAARMLTPYFNKHLPNFETYASQMFQKPVIISNVYLSWSGLDPELVFQHVAIIDSVTQKPSISIRQIKLDFSLLRSLFALKPILDQLKIWGVDFKVHQTAAGDFNLGGIRLSVSDSMTGSSVKTQDMLAWLFSQSQLILHDINIEFINAKGNKLPIVLDNLSLHSLGSTHSLRGEAILRQEVPTTVALELDWQGKMEDLKNVTASLYLYIEGVSLPDRLKQLNWQGWQIKQGIGSTKIWVAWSNNAVQNVQSNFQVYDLELFSPTQQSRKIPRLSGNVIWKREGLDHIISGSDILIDLPKHLWPTVDFSVTLTPNKNNQLAIKKINVNYLNLADISDWLRISQFATKNNYKQLAAVNLRGDIEDLAIDLPIDADVVAGNTAISAQITHFAVDAWDQYPGLQNLTGQLHWDGNQGLLQLNSKMVRVNYPRFFQSSLHFDKISGELVFNQRADTWILNANQLQLTNADVTSKTTFVLTSNANALPTINLSADFSVAKMENLIRYLPTNIFSEPLNRWLTPAFKSGQIDAGTIIVAGNLKDFPFQAKNGKFLITNHVKDLEFNFAPNWPSIHKLNGKITFEGQTLTADSDSGWIYDVPIKQAHATMTNIGVPAPTLLTVQAAFDSDLANGMYFIHHSPLENKIGSDLSAIDLSGKMQLNLLLNVPLAKPEKTTVKGDVAMGDALLNVPDWNLTIEKLKGPFEFTENRIDAKKLQGILFGENVQLVLSTKVNNNESVIYTNLASHISVAEIEKWLTVPLSKVLRGSTNYQAELIVSPKKATQVILTSDLNGVAVNVPAPYGKLATVATDFKLQLVASTDQPLQSKIYYGKLISAALSMAIIHQKLHFNGGDIHLGGGEPELRTTSGIAITGQMDVFDWDTWKNYIDSLSTNKVLANNKTLFVNTWWQHVDVLIKKLLAFGKELDQVQIQLTPLATGLQIGLTTRDMQGQITLPNDPKATVQAKFERLYFSENLQGNVSQWNPKSLPPISFVGNDVRTGDKQLGQLAFNTMPTLSGLSINSLTVNSSAVSLSAKGTWKLSGNTYQTHLQGDVATNDLSKLLKDWGFAQSSLISKKGNFNFNLDWPDAPYKPSLAATSGSASIKLSEGQIVNLTGSQNAQLGLARLLNILSVENLPRRLSGNFSDLTQKGYTFDRVTGNFSFKAGDAFTSDLTVNGAMARIDVAGRIGLAAKNLDLTVNVTPYVTSGLPLVATIATGFNSVAGVATWLVDKMVTQGVSNVVTYRYKVTGGWDKPDWQKV